MNKILTVIKKNSPTILSILACAGVVSTTVLAIKAVPKAQDRQLIALSKKEQKYDTCHYDNEPVKFNTTQLTKKEAIIASIPAYIPTAVSAAATMACILGANALNKKAQASLMSAYMLANQHFNEYRKAAKEVYGEDADRKIKERIAIDNFEKKSCIVTGGFVHSGPFTDGPALEDNDEQFLFYEPYTKRYFWSTVRRVQEAEMFLNRMIQVRGGLSIGEFLEYLGLTVSDDSLYTIGWNADWIVNTTCESSWLDIWNVYTDDDKFIDMTDDADIPYFYTITYMFDPIPNYEDWDWESLQS